MSTVDIANRLQEAEQEWEERTLKPTLKQKPESKSEFTTTSLAPIERLYTPNSISDFDYESELGFLTKAELRDTDDPAAFIEAARSLETRDKTICVTLGKRGALALIEGKPLIIPGHAVKAIDSTGAGDCFVGAVAAQLAAGKSIHDALAYANSAASICVQRMGAAPSMPTIEEVEATFSTSRLRERGDP